MQTTTIDKENKTETAEMVATVAAAFFRSNPVPIEQIGTVFQQVRAGLAGDDATGNGQITPTTQEPAVPIKSSVKPDYIVCLEDGKKLKMLKRHLMSSFNLTPDQYRRKWGLSADYPMVAPNYAAQRRELAMASGLGRVRGSKEGGEDGSDAQTPKKRGRPPKAQ